MSAPTVGDWRERLLALLGAKPTAHNVQFLNAWLIAEGGTATNNPFNTTMEWGTGWTNYNSGGVKNYPVPAQGIEATAKTLLLSGHGYERIVADLRRDATPTETAGAVLASEWGTRTFPSLGDVPAAPASDDPTSPESSSAAPVGCLSAVVYVFAMFAGLGAGGAVAVTLIGWAVQ